MPELPEVETVRRGLAPLMENATIERLELNRPNLRFPFPENFADAVQGQRVVSIGRRAKYLLVDLALGDVIIMHLGMSGSFRTIDGQVTGEFHHPRSKIEKHDHVVFHLLTNQGNPARVIYNDPRRFGFMLMTKRNTLDQHKMMKDLGVEPTGNELDATLLAKKIDGKNAPLKAALLDQTIIAGLGNIYVCEALWRSGLSPTRKARTIVLKSGKASARATLLVENIKQVIQDAIAAGGSSLRDHTQTDGSLGYFQHSFAVYGREGKTCQKANCTGTVNRIVQSGRSTFFCPVCQR